jgi:hypothetical protein
MRTVFLDPRAEPGTAAQPYALGLGARLDRPGVRVGMLANGFADSGTFCAVLGEVLLRHLPGATVAQYAKPNPSLVADDALLARAVSENDAVVAVYGH